MDNYLSDAETKMKKGIVQTALWLIATGTVYFVWGATWYFWILFAISFVLVVSLIIAKVFLAKTQKSLSDIGRIQEDLDDFKSSYKNDDDDEEKIEYTTQQKVLQTLLTELEDIGEEHDEIYDTDCREQMREVVHNVFVFQKEDYVVPNTFGLFSKEGNELVGKALNKYLIAIEVLTQDIKTSKKRLAIFQDDDVYTEYEHQAYDDFFGWVDEEDLKA